MIIYLYKNTFFLLNLAFQWNNRQRIGKLILVSHMHKAGMIDRAGAKAGSVPEKGQKLAAGIDNKGVSEVLIVYAHACLMRNIV